MEGRNVGTRRKSPKRDLTSDRDLTIELPEGRESPYHRLLLLLFLIECGIALKEVPLTPGSEA